MKKKFFMLLFLITLSTVILGMGYASINNITLELDGNVSVKKIDYIRITNVDYKNDVLANLDESNINNYYVTTINSKVVLGNDINSLISYNVTLRNDTERSFKYLDVIHDDSNRFYDNENIQCEVTGIENGEILFPDSEKVITLTFKYKNVPIENNILNSYINIKFNKVFNIEYLNIDSNNLINNITEDEKVDIEFTNPPQDIDIIGDLVYEYNNGVLSISNVKSDIIIAEKNESSSYPVDAESE